MGSFEWTGAGGNTSLADGKNYTPTQTFSCSGFDLSIGEIYVPGDVTNTFITGVGFGLHGVTGDAEGEGAYVVTSNSYSEGDDQTTISVLASGSAAGSAGTLYLAPHGGDDTIDLLGYQATWNTDWSGCWSITSTIAGGYVVLDTQIFFSTFTPLTNIYCPVHIPNGCSCGMAGDYSDVVVESSGTFSDAGIMHINRLIVQDGGFVDMSSLMIVPKIETINGSTWYGINGMYMYSCTHENILRTKSIAEVTGNYFPPVQADVKSYTSGGTKYGVDQQTSGTLNINLYELVTTGDGRVQTQLEADTNQVENSLGMELHESDPTVTLGSTTITVHTADWETARNTDPGAENVAEGQEYKIKNVSKTGTIVLESTDPGVANVLVGQEYKINNSNKVGTFNESARNIDPGVENVLVGQEYKIRNVDKVGTLILTGNNRNTNHCSPRFNPTRCFRPILHNGAYICTITLCQRPDLSGSLHCLSNNFCGSLQR
jgi:hypothetical protein